MTLGIIISSKIKKETALYNSLDDFFFQNPSFIKLLCEESKIGKQLCIDYAFEYFPCTINDIIKNSNMLILFGGELLKSNVEALSAYKKKVLIIN